MSVYQLSPLRRTGTQEPTVRGLQRDVDSLFDNFFHGFGGLPSEITAITPKLNIAETEKAFELTLEIPGVDEKDIDINLSGNLLTVKGEKKDETRDEGKNYYRIERSYGSFQRSFTLPEGVDEDKIQAKSRNGVLEITLPKSEKAKEKNKKIAVKKD